MRPLRGSHLLLLIAGCLVLAGCAPLVSSFPTATPETAIPTDTAVVIPPTSTVTPSPTIEWFPATDTSTPQPTVVKSPTPDPLAAGELVYRDDFSDPEKWVIFQVAGSNITILNQDITFDLDENSGFTYAFRSEPLLTDYFAGVTASPSYCGEGDEYGLMARITGEKRDHYRFTVTCDGRAGVFRVVNERPIQIADWVQHPILARSFPSDSRLALRVEGRDLQFYANDQLLITVEDTVIQRGTVGVFVRAASGEPVLVSFSELEVYSIGAGED
jgi:hypothetical protein